MSERGGAVVVVVVVAVDDRWSWLWPRWIKVENTYIRGEQKRYQQTSKHGW